MDSDVNDRSQATAGAPRNGILAALPPADYTRLQPHLKLLELSVGHVLYEPNSRLDHVYFAENGMISLTMDATPNIGVEVGIIGNDGIAGVGPVLTNSHATDRAVVQVSGQIWELPAEVLQHEFRESVALQELVLRFMRASAVLASRCAVCNCLHSLEQRLSRWLLLVQDVVQSERLDLTAQFLAEMLGVRRDGVGPTLAALEATGCIDLQDGVIVIRNRPRLMTLVCECYGLIYEQYVQYLQ